MKNRNDRPVKHRGTYDDPIDLSYSNEDADEDRYDPGEYEDRLDQYDREYKEKNVRRKYKKKKKKAYSIVFIAA